MSEVDLNKKMNQLKIEDFIWAVYIGIIFMSWYSNSQEREYYLKGDEKFKCRYRSIIILIFTILLFVYVYFLKDSFDELMSLKSTDTEERKKLVLLSFIGSLFICISGAIFLYIALQDEDLNVELAFN